jgi:sugar lactone lactonase YvrE
MDSSRRGALRAAALTGALVVALGAAAPSCTDTSNNAAPGVIDSYTSGAGGAAGTPGADGAAGGGGDDAGTVHIDVPEPGYLWYAGSGLRAFTKAQTQTSNDSGPGVVVVPNSADGSFHDLVFDAAGNLWAIPIGGTQIIRLPAAGLESAAAAPSPDLVLSSGALKGAQSMAFDPAGNLWVLNYAGAGVSIATIVRFDNPRTATGTVMMAPSVAIGPGASPEGIARFTQGTALAFDRAGSLWMAAVADVVRIDGVPALHGNVTAAPAAVVTGGDAYASIAFDAGGSLWITAASNGYTALRVDNPGGLSGVVTLVPAARVHLPTGSSLFASGMAFDADGALWIAMSDHLVKLAGASALTGEVTPAPAVSLGHIGVPDLASKIIVRPTPSGLPIF